MEDAWSDGEDSADDADIAALQDASTDVDADDDNEDPIDELEIIDLISDSKDEEFNMLKKLKMSLVAVKMMTQLSYPLCITWMMKKRNTTVYNSKMNF